MKKIYLEKQFMKATNLNNYIIGEIVAQSKESGEYQIKKEDGSIMTVFSHSILGWEEYKVDSEVGYRFHYHAKMVKEKEMFVCDIYKNGDFFYRYTYGFDGCSVLNTSDSFRYFLLEQGNGVQLEFDDSWNEFRDKVAQKEKESKFDIYIKHSAIILKGESTEQKEDTYALMLKNNKSGEECNMTSSSNLQEVEKMKHILAHSFQMAGVRFKIKE